MLLKLLLASISVFLFYQIIIFIDLYFSFIIGAIIFRAINVSCSAVSKSKCQKTVGEISIRSVILLCPMQLEGLQERS